jgi:threonine dehydrogenase-like Zn-dependent dehydrogenase
VCLTGVSPRGRNVTIDAGALGREIVLRNDAIFGSVNANRAHYEQAAQALADANSDWLQQLITRREPVAQYADALQRHDDDVKVVLEFSD